MKHNSETSVNTFLHIFSFRFSETGGGQGIEYHCQILASFVYSEHVDFPPEERAALHLLSVLYASVFWRAEADLLEF